MSEDVSLKSMPKIKFPNHFLWGAATSAEQCEGRGQTGKGLTKWDLHFQSDPNQFFEKVGPEITSDFARRYVQDIALWAQIGIKAVRLSFSWARLFPDDQKPSQSAVKFYHDVLDELAEHKIKALMTLSHFDLPAWAVQVGGWSNSKVRAAFLNYASLIFREYDAKTEAFATFCEPIVETICGYMGQKCHWPLAENYQLAFNVGNGLILLHAQTVSLFKSRPRHAKIGVVLNLSPVYPRRRDHAGDRKAARAYETLHNRWMLEGMVAGKIGQPIRKLFAKLGARLELTSQNLQTIAQVKCDYLGVNYYFPTRVREPVRAKSKSGLSTLFETWKKPSARYNKSRGWEIYPRGIYRVMMRISREFPGLPFYISENGMGVANENLFRDKSGKIADFYRIDFLKSHLVWIQKALAQGAPCFGFTLWSIFDCWSWLNAYKNRYGLIEIDLPTQTRRLKQSAFWYQKIIKEGGFDV